jgi:hypothetical protein
MGPTLAAKSGKVLEGSVKENASLHPSLKVLPAPEHPPTFPAYTKHDLYPLDADLIEYKGNARYDGGKPAPSRNNGIPDSTHRIQGVIPPISNYTLVPRNTILWVAPDFEINSVGEQRSLTYGATPKQTKTPTANKGVTTWTDDYDSVSTVSGSHPQLAAIPVTNKGVTSWESGYEVVRSISLQSLIGKNAVNRTASMENTSMGPPRQRQVSTIVSRSGVVCWTPGYEVSLETPGLIKTSLGGMWYAPDSSSSSAQGLSGSPTLLEVVPVTLPPAMMAAPLLLPGLRSRTQGQSTDWSSWYKGIAEAIYSRWQSVQVGPGIATIRVTITRARDLSCRVVDFQPAEGAERNAISETAFREAALTTVKEVRTFEIPEFPPASQDEVTFDVELKHTIDGPVGIDISLVRPHQARTTAASRSHP